MREIVGQKWKQKMVKNHCSFLDSGWKQGQKHKDLNKIEAN